MHDDSVVCTSNLLISYSGVFKGNPTILRLCQPLQQDPESLGEMHCMHPLSLTSFKAPLPRLLLTYTYDSVPFRLFSYL